MTRACTIDAFFTNFQAGNIENEPSQDVIDLISKTRQMECRGDFKAAVAALTDALIEHANCVELINEWEEVALSAIGDADIDVVSDCVDRLEEKSQADSCAYAVSQRMAAMVSSTRSSLKLLQY
ncbi:MAG: hypothetical protein H6868_07905 [Rhodospirillales bacterium]|nr:hypothetical protein [Rhodospirillales bacterium]